MNDFPLAQAVVFSLYLLPVHLLCLGTPVGVMTSRYSPSLPSSNFFPSLQCFTVVCFPFPLSMFFQCSVLRPCLSLPLPAMPVLLAVWSTSAAQFCSLIPFPQPAAPDLNSVQSPGPQIQVPAIPFFYTMNTVLDFFFFLMLILLKEQIFF